MKFHVFCRAGAGHSKCLGDVDAPNIAQAAEEMKKQFPAIWENHQRYVECYVSTSSGKYRAEGRVRP